MKTFGDLFQGRDNHFTALRLLAALSVIFTHSWLLIQENITDPLEYATGYTLGSHAVTVFFSLSGFLICASLDRRPNITAFTIARIARIFPGIIICTFLMAIMGAFLTHLTPVNYIYGLFESNFFIKIAIFFSGNMSLLDVFANSPHTPSVNGSIWTIKYEIFCYVLIAFLSAIKLIKLNSFYIVTLITLIIISAFFENPSDTSPTLGPLYNIVRFLSSFYIGMALYTYRNLMPHTIFISIFLFLVAYSLKETNLFYFATYCFLGYTALYFALIPNNTKLPEIDISYGVYIYAWPIQQLLLVFIPTISVAYLTILAAILSMSIGVFSWYLVEHPSLMYARRLIKQDKIYLWSRKKLA